VHCQRKKGNLYFTLNAEKKKRGVSSANSEGEYGSAALGISGAGMSRGDQTATRPGGNLFVGEEEKK